MGALPLLTQVLAGCLNRGARHARPGEFTLRAFLSGRIDLTRAEAVLGVIDARNSAQLDAALRQLAGGLSRPIHDLRDRLLDLVAHLEANLDFADESDVDPLGRAALADELQSSAETLSALADRLTRRDRPAGEPPGCGVWSAQRGQEPAVQRALGARPGDRLAPRRDDPRLSHRGLRRGWNDRRAH